MTYDEHREKALDIDIFREEMVDCYDEIALFVDETLDQSFYNMTTSEIINTLGLDKNSVIIDLGACRGGQITDYVSLGAEVHAFEPHPMHAHTIKETFSNYQNLIFHDYAAGHTNCDVSYLYFKGSPDDDNGGASMLPFKLATDDSVAQGRFNHDPGMTHIVKTIDIAKYIFELDKDIDILKIDVEGLEYLLMWRLLETGAASRIKHIFFADHRQNFLATVWFESAVKTIDVIKRNPEVMNKMHHRHT